MSPPSPVLTAAELQAITGYRRAADQLPELQRQGFHRARRSPTTGDVILERAHYEAICRGEAANDAQPRPKVRPPRVRQAAQGKVA